MSGLGHRPALEGPPRVPVLDDPSPEQLEILSKTPTRADGRHLNVFRTLLHHPRLLKRFHVLAGAFQKGVLPVADRELVILRVTAACQAEYEFAEHSRIALRCGLTADDVEHLRGGLVSPAWDTRQTALVAFVDDLLEDDAVEDATWAAVPFHSDPAAMLELVLLIGFYRMAAGLTNAARVEPEVHDDPVGVLP